MGRVLDSIFDFIGGLWVLMTLAVASKFRLKGRYWSWRSQTAFPDGKPPRSAGGLMKMSLEYASWAWRIRRLR